MDTIHVVFGMFHNWLFWGVALVLLTFGLTVMAFIQKRRSRALREAKVGADSRL